MQQYQTPKTEIREKNEMFYPMFYNPYQKTINFMYPGENRNMNINNQNRMINSGLTINRANHIKAGPNYQQQDQQRINQMQKLNMNAKLLNDNLHKMNNKKQENIKLGGAWSEKLKPESSEKTKQRSYEKNTMAKPFKGGSIEIESGSIPRDSNCRTYSVENTDSNERQQKENRTDTREDYQTFEGCGKEENLRVHMNLKYLKVDCLEMKNILRKQLGQFLKKFREQFGNVQGVKMILKSSEKDSPFLPNSTYDWESSNLSRDFSSSEPFDKNAKRRIQSELINVLSNSLLDKNQKSNHKKIIEQASKVNFKIFLNLKLKFFQNKFF